MLNHLSNADPALIHISGIKRMPRFMAKEELFAAEMGLKGKVVALFGSFPVKQNSADTASIKEAKKLLLSGNIVAIFPEGHVNRTKQRLLPLKEGVALLAKIPGVRVVCGVIRNTNVVWPGDDTMKPTCRYPMEIVYGVPKEFDRKCSRKEIVAWISDQLTTL